MKTNHCFHYRPSAQRERPSVADVPRPNEVDVTTYEPSEEKGD